MPYVGKKPADIIATAVDTTTGTFSGDIDASTVNATGDTAAGDNAAIGFTSAEGLILTGQGSTSDITVKNDADATVFTVPTGTDDILFPDNAKAMFGASSDLQIYHTSGFNQIETSNGPIQIKTSSENMIKAIPDGAIELYHNNVKKFETTSGGVTVTGDLGATTGTISTGIQLGNGTTDGYILIEGGTNAHNDLVFESKPSNGGAIERMKLDSSGNLLINTTTSATAVGIVLGNNGQTTMKRGTGGDVQFFVNSGSGNEVGKIQISASSTSYITSSDYRLKENVTTSWDATSRLKQLKPSRFNFKVDKDTTVDGFLAHEVSSIVPEAITGKKDGVKVWEDGDELPDGVSVGDNKLDADGNTIPDYQGIDQSKLVPLLTKALQEQQATIEALTARIVTLENA